MTTAPRVRIVHLDLPALRALAAGSGVGVPVPVTGYLTGPEVRHLWEFRSRQVEGDPPAAAWVTGIVRDDDRGLSVGAAGFHGPPDADGMVEVGYRIDPAYRRRGYARAALESLLDRAAVSPPVRRVRASIRPDNEASYALVARYGFEKAGEQWDDEDGLEIVYEVDAAALRSGAGPGSTVG